MVENFPHPEQGMEKIEVVASSKDERLKNCIVIKPGVVPTIFEIVSAATNNEARIEAEPDQYFVQFPGEGQELLTYSEIFKKLENLPKAKS
jgi:hypothetical protein